MQTFRCWYLCCRNGARSEELYTWYTRCVSSGRHLYSSHTLRVLLYSSHELQVWMQSRIHWWWSQLQRWAKAGSPYSTQILGVFPLHQIAHVGVSERVSLKIFGREIIFEEFQPMWSRYPIVTDRRTDGQTTCNLGVASRCKNWDRHTFTTLPLLKHTESRLIKSKLQTITRMDMSWLSALKSWWRNSEHLCS